MHQLLFINTFFEEELTAATFSPLEFMQKNPIHLQLHYLSCLIAENNETPLLYLKPEDSYFTKLSSLGISFPSPACFDSPSQEKNTITSFGASPSLALWAKKHNYLYSIPSLDLIKKVHSKEFSFLITPQLKEAELIFTKEELISWWKSTKGPKVLKTFHGFSGRGHFISKWDGEDIESALNFFKNKQSTSPGLIAEPWVDRILDFSSQWEIHKNGSYSYIGSTICLNSPRGVYRKTFTGIDSLLFQSHLNFLQEHLSHAEQAIKKIAALGFFGNLGFDAMLYKSSENNKIKLHPIVEINARKTMGWVAIKIQQKLQWEEELMVFSYEINKQDKLSWLPDSVLTPQGKTLPFKAQLVIEKIKPSTFLVCF